MTTKSTLSMVLLLVAWFGMPLGAQSLAGPHRPAGVPDGYVITPFGYFHPTCVLKVAQGETLLADGRIIQRADGTLENLPECKYAHYAASGEIVAAGATQVESPTVNGWVESASVTTSTSYGEIVATWTVPPAPTSVVGQTVFFFPGMEDSNDVVSIIQPVLQFGPSAAGGGNYWAIASWNCCPSGTADYSTVVNVNAGDTIQGTVKSTCSAGTESCATWDITTADETSGKSTTLTNSPSEGQTFNWAFGGVLEAYNIAQCSDYPPNASITFQNIALYNDSFTLISNPAWSMTYWATSETPQCDYSGQVSATKVTLYYGAVGSPTATLSPSSLNFGQVPTNGPPKVEGVTLTNNNTVTLTISETTFTGDGGFGINHNYCGSSLGALSSCTIDLQLDTSSGGCGKYTGTFYVYDSATNSPQSVALTGVGVNHIAGGC